MSNARHMRHGIRGFARLNPLLLLMMFLAHFALFSSISAETKVSANCAVAAGRDLKARDIILHCGLTDAQVRLLVRGHSASHQEITCAVRQACWRTGHGSQKSDRYLAKAQGQGRGRSNLSAHREAERRSCWASSPSFLSSIDNFLISARSSLPHEAQK